MELALAASDAAGIAELIDKVSVATAKPSLIIAIPALEAFFMKSLLIVFLLHASGFRCQSGKRPIPKPEH
jgi:hypothetical protein